MNLSTTLCEYSYAVLMLSIHVNWGTIPVCFTTAISLSFVHLLFTLWPHDTEKQLSSLILPRGTFEMTFPIYSVQYVVTDILKL
jgi:hypothetical protein